MITHENLKEVLNSLTSNAKNRIRHTRKKYVVLEHHVSNTGSYATIKLTDDFIRYRNVSDKGNRILCVDTAKMLLED